MDRDGPKFNARTVVIAGQPRRGKRGAPRTPSASVADKIGDRRTVAAVGLPSGSRLLRTASTSAEPTTTPSAPSAMARACSAGTHAEADADRKLGMPLDARDRVRDLAGVRRRRAGNAGDRDVIDKARRVREHGRQPFVVGRRRGEADEIEAGLERRQAQFRVLLRRQIDDDQPVDAGALASARN